MTPSPQRDGGEHRPLADDLARRFHEAYERLTSLRDSYVGQVHYTAEAEDSDRFVARTLTEALESLATVLRERERAERLRAALTTMLDAYDAWNAQTLHPKVDMVLLARTDDDMEAAVREARAVVLAEDAGDAL